MSANNSVFMIVSVLVFVSVVLLVEAVRQFWQARRGQSALRLQRRLEQLSRTMVADGQRPLLKQRKLSELPALARMLDQTELAPGLERYLAQAGLGWTVAGLLLASGAAAGTCFLAASLVAGPGLFNVFATFALGLLPWACVAWARAKRLHKLQQQLPDALDLIARALRAGHALPLGIQLLSEEMQEPVAGEFRQVHEQVSFGVSLEQALTHLCERVPLTDYRYFAVSVLIQRQSGGNLTEVLGNLSRLIRERLKLLARVRVLSAEGRMSAWALSVMPFALGALIYVFNPDFMRPLWTDPVGTSMLRTLTGMMLVGVLVLVRIVKIRV
jgi:tight adherence protein B